VGGNYRYKPASKRRKNMRELTSAELEAVSGGQTMEEYGILAAVVTSERAIDAILEHFPVEHAP
jgi:hypothetical protein